MYTIFENVVEWIMYNNILIFFYIYAHVKQDAYIVELHILHEVLRRS